MEIGLRRSESLSSLERLSSGIRSHNDVMLLEDKSNVVRNGAGSGTSKVLRPLEETFRMASEEN